jgi:hypothetical protein
MVFDIPWQVDPKQPEAVWIYTSQPDDEVSKDGNNYTTGLLIMQVVTQRNEFYFKPGVVPLPRTVTVCVRSADPTQFGAGPTEISLVRQDEDGKWVSDAVPTADPLFVKTSAQDNGPFIYAEMRMPFDYSSSEIPVELTALDLCGVSVIDDGLNPPPSKTVQLSRVGPGAGNRFSIYRSNKLLGLIEPRSELILQLERSITPTPSAGTDGTLPLTDSGSNDVLPDNVIRTGFALQAVGRAAGQQTIDKKIEATFGAIPSPKINVLSINNDKKSGQ